jgi:hypothetical protein
MQTAPGNRRLPEWTPARVRKRRQTVNTSVARSLKTLQVLTMVDVGRRYRPGRFDTGGDHNDRVAYAPFAAHQGYETIGTVYWTCTAIAVLIILGGGPYLLNTVKTRLYIQPTCYNASDRYVPAVRYPPLKPEKAYAFHAGNGTIRICSTSLIRYVKSNLALTPGFPPMP